VIFTNILKKCMRPEELMKELFRSSVMLFNPMSKPIKNKPRLPNSGFTVNIEDNQGHEPPHRVMLVNESANGVPKDPILKHWNSWTLCNGFKAPMTETRKPCGDAGLNELLKVSVPMKLEPAVIFVQLKHPATFTSATAAKGGILYLSMYPPSIAAAGRNEDPNVMSPYGTPATPLGLEPMPGSHDQLVHQSTVNYLPW
jgi:hypothetical protein